MTRATVNNPPSEITGGFQRIAAYWTAPMVLITVAFVQFGECHLSTLTPWKGGGFGMFSTSDAVDARFSKAYLLTDEGEIPILVPARLFREKELTQTWPDQAQLEMIAVEMTKCYWLRGHSVWSGFEAKQNRLDHPELRRPADRPRMVFSTLKPELYGKEYESIYPRGVRLELWRTRISSDGSALNAELWMSVTKMTSAPSGVNPPRKS